MNDAPRMLMNRPRTARSCVLVVLLAGVAQVFGSQDVLALTDTRDTLDKAMDPVQNVDVMPGETYDVFAAEQYTYDSNLFRLPSQQSYLFSLVGPYATRDEQIDTTSVGLDGRWTVSRQEVDVNLRADENHYQRNTDLNNLSSNDRAAWLWHIGDPLSGEVGAIYYRGIASFVNSNVFTLNIVNSTEIFGTARYQIGPRWVVYGGVMDDQVDLSAALSKTNNNHLRAVDLGTEYSWYKDAATNKKDAFGWDYRFTDTRFPEADVVRGNASNTDYREDLERFQFKYALYSKLNFQGYGGYLKRDYVYQTGESFSGDIWNASLDWQTTGTTELSLNAWRRLQAYLTAQSDYFVSEGISLSPVWVHSSQITVTLQLSHDDQDYIRTSSPSNSLGQRRDVVNAEQVSVSYRPLRLLSADLSFRHEARESNLYRYSYHDQLAFATVTLQF